MSEAERREEAVFEAALQLRGTERAAYLDQACAGDPQLRQRIEALLGALERAGGLLNEPAVARSEASEVPSLPPTEKPGDRIGRYKLLQQIGEGGCGVVYMAEQEEPVRRRVALKVIKLGMDTKSVIARFEAERQALALMDHPNIAKVFDAGATDGPHPQPLSHPMGEGGRRPGEGTYLPAGRPYFVMELVRGVKITEFCDENNLAMPQRLELFIQVCQAIQHAHQKGIIHRDIKPSNILVTVNDGVPVPKVIDFGIAKATTGQQLTDKTLFTAFEQFIGTPAYMSPEQAVLTSLDIDTRSDIYSLGVLLYELLTGKTPFDAKELLQAGFDEMRRTIREKEPARPSTRLSTMLEGELSTTAKRRHIEPPKLIHLVRGDLDWIVMKCLEKDRMRRYETANGLAMDLRRHLDNEPVIARPPGAAYRFQKLVRRNKLAFAAAGAVVLALLAGVGISTWQAIRATRAERDQNRLREAAQQAQKTEAQQRRLASEQESLARRRFYAAQMNLAMQAWDAGQLPRTLELLETQRPAVGRQDLRNFEWFHLWGLCNARLRLTLRGHTSDVSCVAFSPDGRTLASSSEDGTIRLWDAVTGHEGIVQTPEPRSMINAVVFTPDGKTLASASWDRLVRLWDVASGQLRATLSGHPAWVRTLAVSPDGRTLASGGDQGVVKLWDLGTGIERMNLRANEEAVLSMAFSPDGTTLAVCSGWGRDDGVWLWNLTRNPAQPKAKFPGSRALAWCPDGKMLATVAVEKIELWNTDTGRLRTTLNGHQPPINGLAFLPDGNTLVSCAQDRTLRLWLLSADEAGNVESQIVGAHLDTASSLAVSKDGTMLASGASDGSIKLWNLAESREQPEARIAATFKCGTNADSWSDLQSLLPLPGTDTVLVVTRDGTEIRDLTSGQKLSVLPEAVGRGALSPDGKLLATSRADGTVKLSAVATSRVLASISIHAHPQASISPALAFSPDGRTLATGGFENDNSAMLCHVTLWDATAGLKPIRTITASAAGITAVGFSPDGKRLAVALRHRRVLIVDPATGHPEQIIEIARWVLETMAMVFSPDGHLLATGGDGGTVKLLDLQTGRLHAALKGHTTTVWAIAFSPDGSTVATGSSDQTVRLWDVATGQERVTFKRHRDAVTALAFSLDGNTLVTGDRNGTVWMLRGTHTAQADEESVPMDEATVSAADYNFFAWALATDADSKARDGHRAVDFAAKAVAATSRKNPMILDTLAAAYAEAGQFTNAVAVQQEAIALLQNEEQKKDCTSRLRLYESNLPYRDHGRLAERAGALPAEGKFPEADPLARQCLAIRETMIPDDWRTFNARSVLGGCLLGQKKYAEAESLLISGYEGMRQREGKIPPAGKARPQQALQRLVQLYEETNRRDQAAEWKKKLTETEQFP